MIQSTAAEAGDAESQTYLRQAWYAAGWAKDLDSSPLPKVMLEEEIVLYRKSDGGVVALGNRCAHRFVELHNGKVVGDNIQCPYHGLEYNSDGRCALNPHGGNLPVAARVKSYPAVEKDELIWIWMGLPAEADINLIPDFSILADTAHAVVRGTFPIAGDYQLYSDNLLDLSHGEYIHPQLLESGSLVRSTARVEQEGDTVHFIRDSEEEPATGTFQRMLCEGMGGKLGDIVHTRHHIKWDAPANIYAEITQFREDKRSILTNVHIAVPTYRGKSELIWAAVRNFSVDNKEIDEYLFNGMKFILGEEDIPAIESQATYIGSSDLLSLRPVLLPTDEAPVRARRVLSKLIRKEASEATLEEKSDTTTSVM